MAQPSPPYPPPQIYNGPPLRVELSISGPVHIHHHSGGVSAEDVILMSHLESLLRRTALRVKRLDEQTPPPK